MPLLRRQKFVREKPPPDLHPDEEVLHCKLTNEIFRDYEKFFERVILCNSLVWSCSITGKSGMTYQEAVECEQKALKQLASLPDYLQKPILYLATLTHRGRLVDMNDDVFMFTKDRYFVGETVEMTKGGVRKTCKILRVVPPPVQANGPIVIDDDDSDDSAGSKNACLKPDQVQYAVMEKGKSASFTVNSKALCRKKGLYTRDKSKLFLKQHCETIFGVWTVKADTKKKLGIDQVKFEDFFVGPPPKFEVAQIKKRTSSSKLTATHTISELTSQEPKPRKDKDKQKKETAVKEPVPNPAQAPSPQPPKLSPEEKSALKEKIKQEKMEEKMRKREELRKKIAEEKQRLKEEKAKEREKKMEEMRIQAELFHEWNKPRDDMECDDLRVMPEPHPVKCRLPPECFGDALMVLEFVNCFSSVFELKESFPKGFTFEILEKALRETDASGLLADLLLMMLTAIFSLQEEEEEEEQEMATESKESKGGGRQDPDVAISDMSTKQLIESATVMAQIPQSVHGLSLRKLPLDNFTLTEILRLHILGSGAEANLRNAKFRYQQRGGYTPIDDAGLEFKRQEAAVLRNLAKENIYDLPPSDKLKILKLLVDQFLTYAAVRDVVEDNYDTVRQLRIDLKQLQMTEQRREREEAALRHKRRMEERARERERLLQKRMKELKDKEEQIKKDEGRNVDETSRHSGQSVEKDGADSIHSKDTEEIQIDEDEDEMTQDEREAQRQKEDDLEARKKAEFALKEREFVENIMTIAHSNAVYPLGHDRIYRRYWIFNSIPGVFVENNEEYVPKDLLQPVSQNIQGSIPTAGALPPKLMKKPGGEDGSDKENESLSNSGFNNSAANSAINMTFNSTVNSSINSPMNISVNGPIDPSYNLNSTNISFVTSATNNGLVTEPGDGVKKDKGDCIVIDEENSNPPQLEAEERAEPPPMIHSPATLQLQNMSLHQWAYFATEEEIEKLIESLNSRGFRESALKQSLLEQKVRIIETISKCPVSLLSVEEEKQYSEQNGEAKTGVQVLEVKPGRRAAKGTVQNDSAQEALELNLREMLLDLEERIYVGFLGAIKVFDRAKWRSAIEDGNYDPQCDDPIFAKSEKQPREETGRENEDIFSAESNNPVLVVQDLTKALAQISRGLDPKYLIPPLAGDAEENKPQQKSQLERWEESLLQSTSLSQVFLHLSTLEKSVAWSKSTLHTRCRLCRRKGDAEKMLLCDGCDRGHHMYCLKPPLKNVPEGDWFCPACRPKDVHRSPRKGRRTFSAEESSEEEDTSEEEKEEEESDEEEEEEEEEEEIENDSVCAVCQKGGTLILCDNCPLSYHLACANPPLKKVPKGKWLCQICSGTDKKAGKIVIAGNSKKGKTTLDRSSAKSTPRSSPLTLKAERGKKRAVNSDSEDEKPKLKKSSKSSSKLPRENGDDSHPKYLTSSSRGNTKVQQLKMFEEVVMELINHEDSWPFLKPVDKKLVPDYYEIIEKPMDFSTIRNKINKFHYNDPEELEADVRQIFQNCIEYNKRSTVEFKCGTNLSKLLDKRLKEVASLDSSAPPSKRARTK
ncbi:hypothetical protein ACJMK2_036658 [Sinanodonta woodiana]|uniref:Bromodomain adjacent to zinc finger domain protein 1A n=1 Tax=Sinanodonta woodiana TaxID=1069815 RepID=A0ABD3WHX1_SINWO